MQETSSVPGSYERTLGELIAEVRSNCSCEDSPYALTLCAPKWVLERVSEETGAQIEASAPVATLTTGSLVLAAVPTLELDESLGYLAAVNVITGHWVELTACHAEIAPGRWAPFTLAIKDGLAPSVCVAIEMIGVADDL